MNMRLVRAWSASLLIVLAGGSSPANAQAVSSASLRDQLQAYGNRIVTTLGANSPEIASEVKSFAELFALEVSTAPLGNATGGFTYVFDTSVGGFVRKTNSFGPMFANRSITQGKGRISAGVNFLHADYNSLAGFGIANGELVTGKNFKGLPLPIDSTPLRLYASSNTVVASASYGVTDNVDVGLIVPWVRISAGADFAVLGPGNVDLTPGGRTFLFPTTSAAGFGDIAIFGRYHVWHHADGGVLADVQVRLPTGDEGGLRGLGITRTRFSAVWSQGGRLAPHANAGYEVWSSEVPISFDGSVFARHQVDYAFGVEFQPHPRTTLSLDIIGRRQLHGGQLSYRTIAFGPGTVDALLPVEGGVSVVSFAPGIKWNVAGNALFSGGLLTTLMNDGMRAHVIPVVGLEWAF